MSSISDVYHERDQLVAAISKVFESHIYTHDENDPEYEHDFRHIICVHLPTGQASWHIHEYELPLFSHLMTGSNYNDYDGHSTPQKYDRLNDLTENDIYEVFEEYRCSDCSNCGKCS